ncbi:MAG TPA: hypothetical protein PK466_12815 [Thermotogota bacterium]|nr:hypothetical protein [Thermotogota bacterium]HPJ89987.1 hypothetical protein [Thermotogota bacterium]HPR97204.1 hypothetical protein [Thermotogota bacterium]
MKKTILQQYVELAREGTRTSIGKIMNHLNENMTLLESRFIDFALGHVESDEGLKTMEYYLFHGTQIQRNYCTLFFNRRDEFHLVKKACDEGLIDELQAYSR